MKRRLISLAAILALAGGLAACITPYEGRSAVCDRADPNSPGWPYCHDAPPGGRQPGD